MHLSHIPRPQAGLRQGLSGRLCSSQGEQRAQHCCGTDGQVDVTLCQGLSQNSLLPRAPERLLPPPSCSPPLSLEPGFGSQLSSAVCLS